MKIYAMSDIHGCIQEFDYALSLIDLSGDNKLLLLGDYVHGPNSYAVLDRIMQLQEKYGEEKVVALAGNHEEMCVAGQWRICNNDDFDESREDEYISWMMNLPKYYATEKQIFCHAGICEEAGEFWEWSTDDFTYTEKFPAQIGKFYMDIIAGHISTAQISGDRRFNDVYFDGQSHYYIDGNVLSTGFIPVLMVDTETNKYYRVTESGPWLILPYDEEN